MAGMSWSINKRHGRNSALSAYHVAVRLAPHFAHLHSYLSRCRYHYHYPRGREAREALPITCNRICLHLAGTRRRTSMPGLTAVKSTPSRLPAPRSTRNSSAAVAYCAPATPGKIIAPAPHCTATS